MVHGEIRGKVEVHGRWEDYGGQVGSTSGLGGMGELSPQDQELFLAF